MANTKRNLERENAALRLQLARQREILRRVYVWSDYADVFPADLKRDLAGAIDAADDALAVTEAAA